MAAPFRWLMKSLDVGRKNPKAYFGAIALFMLAVVVISGVQMLAQAMLMDSFAALMVVYGVTSLITVIVISIMSGGIYRILHASDRGLPTKATDVFSAFGRPEDARRLVLVSLVYSGLYVLVIALVLQTAVGQFLREYFAMTMAMQPGAEPDMQAITELFGRAPAGLAWSMLLLFVGAVLWSNAYMFSLAVASLRDDGVLASARAGAMAVLKNILQLLVFVFVLCTAGFIAMFLVMLVVMLLAVALAMVSPVLASLLTIPLLLLMMVVIYSLMFAFYFHGWRDIFGEPVVDPGDSIAA
jgi:hypothetical protein